MQSFKIITLSFLLVIPTITFANEIKGDAKQGKIKALACAGCHGSNGISSSPVFPNLAGQKEAYLKKAIRSYQIGERNDPIMNAMVAALSAADIANIAAHFSSLPRK